MLRGLGPVTEPNTEPQTELRALPSREFGLALGLIVGRTILGMEDLHFGYWPDGLDLEPKNLPEAQARYTEFVVSQIPSGVRTILDVGCGTGSTAAKLVSRGYSVDCLSPNPHLNQLVRERLGDQVGIFEGRFEDYSTTSRYDLILFSESLLFVHPLRLAFEKASQLLNPGGHVLISDLFRTTTIHDPGPIGGGHYLEPFEKELRAFAWEVVADHDITNEVARSFDLLNRGAQSLRPAYDLVLTQLQTKYPFWFKLLRWRFGAKLERYEKKHFSGQRDGENFKRYKRYRVLLLRRPSGSAKPPEQVAQR